MTPRRARSRDIAEPKRPRQGPGVYEDRDLSGRPGRGWVQAAETNPLTGDLEWMRDWGRRAQGWVPLEEWLRDREEGA
jgi:hypothetical protein